MRFEHVTKRFRNLDGSETLALDNVSFDVPSGGISVIGGRNGSGKSLLMRMAAGLLRPDSGKVVFGNGAHGVGVVFQNVHEAILGDSAMDDVLLSLGMKDRKANDKEKTALELLESVGLADKRDRPGFSLSSGEGRRLAIASIAALDREAVFFDEPYSNLDYPGVKEVNALIKRMADGGKTVVVITHEMEKCLGMAKWLTVLSEGKMVYSGPPGDALDRLEEWGIRNPLSSVSALDQAVWM